MAVTIQIFILFLGVVLVKSHHLHSPNPHHHHNGLPNFYDTLYPGIFRMVWNDGSQPDGYIEPVNNYDGVVEQAGNEPNEPDNHLNITSKEPPTHGIQGLNSHPNEVPVNNVDVNLPANTDGQKNGPQCEPNLNNYVDINQSQANIVPDIVEGPKINVDAVQKFDSKDKPQGKNDNSIGIEETVLRFNHNDIKKGTLMVDPELKKNDTNIVINKYSDSLVFPDEVKKQNQVSTSDVQQNLPNRLNVGDNDKQYPSVTAPGVAPATAPTNNNYNPSQWRTSNNPQTSDNQGTQNQYTNQPNSVVFIARPNQQVPVSNGNGSPYVNVVRNPNGDYTIVNIPGNNCKPGLFESLTSNGNSAGNNPGQLYLSGSSGVNSPSQSYVTGNSEVNNPSQIYVPINGNSEVNNAGQTYVITDGANSGVNNPGQTYVITDGANSGVNNPGQTYVITDGANSGVNNPGQIYVIANGANSGVNNPGQVYLHLNSESNNPGTTYVPPSTGQTTNGVYYSVIQLSNGQIILVPVNNGNGQNVQWNGQSNNVVSGGSTNNVPLLISYKDKDGKDKEKKRETGSIKDEKEE